MSGCPSTVGKKGRIARYMGRRVDCMMGFCRPVRYHEVLWPRTRMRNEPPFCKRGATKCQAAAGGVGTNHNIPYYRTPKRGESGCTPVAVIPDPAAALQLLRSYFQLTLGSGGSVILVGKKETLAGDGITAHFDEMKHYYSGTSEYSVLPAHIKGAVDVINNLGVRAPLQEGGTPVPHVVGWESNAGIDALMRNKYGQTTLELGSDRIRIFGWFGCGLKGALPCQILAPSDEERDGVLGTVWICDNEYKHPVWGAGYGKVGQGGYSYTQGGFGGGSCNLGNQYCATAHNTALPPYDQGAAGNPCPGGYWPPLNCGPSRDVVFMGDMGYPGDCGNNAPDHGCPRCQ